MHKILRFFLKLFEYLILLSILAGSIFAYWYYVEYQPRALLKSYCHDSNCACFNNLVDYRFSNAQIKSFSRYLESLQVRPETQLLEFTTLDEVKNILSILQICQPKQVSEAGSIQEGGHPEEISEETNQSMESSQIDQSVESSQTEQQKIIEGQENA